MQARYAFTGRKGCVSNNLFIILQSGGVMLESWECVRLFWLKGQKGPQNTGEPPNDWGESSGESVFVRYDRGVLSGNCFQAGGWILWLTPKMAHVRYPQMDRHWLRTRLLTL